MSNQNIDDIQLKQNIYIDPAVRNQLIQIPDDAPQWKQTVIHRKNQRIIELAIKEAEARRDPYAGEPEWKKPLLHRRDSKLYERQMQEENEKRIREENMLRFNTNPIWRKDLIIRKNAQNIEKAD